MGTIRLSEDCHREGVGPHHLGLRSSRYWISYEGPARWRPIGVGIFEGGNAAVGRGKKANSPDLEITVKKYDQNERRGENEDRFRGKP